MAKCVIVTGGAQGIGKGIARHLLHLGYGVAIADIDSRAGEETLKEYWHLGEILHLVTDVSDEASVRLSIGQAVDRFGRLDGLVNNAGIADPHSSPVDLLSLDDWNRFIAVNLTGCFIVAKHCIPHLRKTKGAIVNIASTRTLQSEPDTEAYAAAKGGLVSLTHALAMSLGPDIRVNCISPGWIDVKSWQKTSRRGNSGLRVEDHARHPAGRVGVPADIAGLAAYLLSDDAGFITGQNFIVDGGMTRKMIYAE